MRRSLLERLAGLADSLDKMGLNKQANIIDEVIKKSAANKQWSNNDTYHAALVINNTPVLYHQLRARLEADTKAEELAEFLKKMFKSYSRNPPKNEKPTNVDIEEVNWLEIAKDEIEGHELDKENDR